MKRRSIAYDSHRAGDARLRLAFFLAVAGFLVDPATAQVANEARPTERRTLMYRIVFVDAPGDSTLATAIGISATARPFVGSIGKVLSVYGNGVEGRGGADEIGHATVLQLGDDLAYLAVRLTDPGTDEGRLYEGDVVELPTDVPARDYRSVFFELASRAIFLLDNDSNPLFTLDEVLDGDSEAYEEDLLSRMAADVHATAEFIRPLIPSNPQWDIQLEKGRFQGLKMVDAMARTEPRDVRAFLQFVNSYPGKYIGRDWKINETFATWIINAAPPGAEEMRDELLALAGTPELEARIADYRDELGKAVFLTRWNQQSVDWAGAGRFDEAYGLSDLVGIIVERLGDRAQRAHWLFSRARIASRRDDHEASVAYYRESEAIFEELGDASNRSAAANNLGLALNDLDRFEDGLAFFDESIRVRQQTPVDSRDSGFLYNLAGSWYGRGTSLQELGRYEEALAAYVAADSLYLASGTSDGLRYSAYARQRMGKSLNRLGRYDEAIARFEAAGASHEARGDAEGQADVLDDLAFLLSQLGRKQEALDSYRRAFDLHTVSGELRDAGYSMSQVGQVHWQMGDYEQAIGAHREAIRLREQAADRSGSAYSWLKLAGLFKDAGDPSAAIAAYDTAASLYEEIGDRSGQADVLDSLGDLYKTEGDLARAIRIHGQALEIRESIGARSAIATSLSNLADDHFKENNYDVSWAYYERSAALRREMGDRAGLARELGNLGLLSHFHRRDYAAAQRYYDDAIRLATEISSAPDQAFAFAGLGRVHGDAGDLPSAMAAYEQALERYSSTSDRVTVLLSIGDIHRMRGELDQARERFEQAERMAHDANSRRDQASALTSLADLDRLTGDVASSLRRSRESLRIFQEVDNPWGIASARIAIGNTLNEMAANQLAIREYETADSLFESVDNDLARATPSNNIGTIYYHQGDYDRALPFFLEAYRLQTEAKIEDEFQVIILQNIGEAHLEAGRLDEAKPWLTRALELSDRLGTRRIGASVRAVTGRYHVRNGDLAPARTMLEEALLMAREVGEVTTTVEVLTRLGEVHLRESRPEEARATLDEAVSLARKVGYTRWVWKPLQLLGTLESERGNAAAAIDYLRQSIDAVEQLRGRIAGGDEAKSVFSSGERGEVYEALIALLVRQGEVEQAMAYLGRSQNAELQRRLQALDVRFSSPEQAALYEEGKTLESRVDQLQERIAAQRAAPNAEARQDLIERLEQMVTVAEAEYNRFVNTTLKRNEELSRHFGSRSDPAQFFRSKDRIPENAAVVAYLPGETQLYIFVATREEVTARVLDVGRSEVASLVARAYESISVAPGSSVRRGAGAAGGGDAVRGPLDPAVVSDLYRILIDPIEAQIGGKEFLAVMPSGHLFLLPFPILSRSGTMDDALLKRHTVFSISDLDVFLGDARPEDPRLVAFGNADRSLPNAEVEVRDIAGLFENAQVYVRDDATEARAKQTPATFNVLHLATHGTLDFTDFENSYLTLATVPGEEEDGRLTLGEIWGLSTLRGYRLVTLSACRSAVNDSFEDGWPVSPATAFFDVGVSTVVASLWEVDDTATAALMREFYGRLAGSGTAEALRAAQLALLSTPEYADPFYWAPFVVTGDWR